MCLSNPAGPQLDFAGSAHRGLGVLGSRELQKFCSVPHWDSNLQYVSALDLKPTP